MNEQLAMIRRIMDEKQTHTRRRKNMRKPLMKKKTKVVEFRMDPYRGAAALMEGLLPPEGYKFLNMTRDQKGNVKVTFEEE